MNNNYMIYSGFFKNMSENIKKNQYAEMDIDDWSRLWLNNTSKYSTSTINIFGPDYMSEPHENKNQIITHPNLGHIGEYLNGSRMGKWCGWTAGIIFGMMHAYVNCVDFIYKEQDCLWFGNCVDKMYDELGNSDIIFGSCRVMGHAQSLFLIKRNAIPDIIAQLSQSEDRDVLPEYKFGHLKNYKKLSFGYDRDRPFNKKDKVFYIQQVTKQDLDILKTEGLI